MALTLTNLQTEFAARGFGYLDASGTTRQTYYLNRAYQELCGAGDWPFLEATSTGTAPLTISDLRTIESVIDPTSLTKLTPLTRQAITDTEDTSLTTTGTATFYYLTAGTTVNTYPVTTDSLSVRYWKVPADLSSGSDTPVLPARFHLAIVDGAVAFAYLDSDNFAAGQQALAVFQNWKDRMREELTPQQHDQPDQVIVLDPSWVC